MFFWQLEQIMEGTSRKKESLNSFYSKIREREVKSFRYPAWELVLEDLLHRRRQILHLRQDHILELWLVRAKRIHRRDALHWRIEFMEQFTGNARRDLGAKTPAEHVFVRNDYAVVFADRRGDGFPIVGRKGSKVDDLDVDAFAMQLRRGYFRP